MPTIHASLYSTVKTTMHPSRSIISILSFTLFPFLTGPLNRAWGPVPLLSHAFFLPKFWLCSSAPLRAPQPLYSSFVASRKTFISHLFLQDPPHPPLTALTLQHTCTHPLCRSLSHTHTPPFFFFPVLPSSLQKKGRKGMQMLDPPELIAHSLFLFSFSRVLSLSILLTHFSPSADPCGWSSCYITGWTHWHTEPHRGSCPSQYLHACLLSLSPSRSVDLVSKSVLVYNLIVYTDRLSLV